MPDPIDLADLWLVDALACLLDACSVPEADRQELVESGIDASELEASARSPAMEDLQRPARLDACRRALVFAALALEARINGVLRFGASAEWEALAHLAPVERFRLSPRLLGRPEAAARDAQLADLAVQVFSGRDELVGAGESADTALTDASSGLSPSHAGAMVEATAKICSSLVALTGLPESGTAQLVSDAADALTRRADRLSSALELSAQPSPGCEWNGFEDFPPNLIGG